MGELPWQSVAEHFQRQRAASIPSQWVLPEPMLEEIRKSKTRMVDIMPHLVPTDVREITALSASAVTAKIREREYTCLEITKAFCHQAAIAHQLTNCLTEIFFDEAFQRAEELDRILSKSGMTLGPLHGVPISVKDHINLKGHHSTAGFIARVRRPVAEKDAHFMEILRNAGAVFFAKTNNPQSLMAVETVNNVFGRTLNPWNTNLSAGGSSGGEGALLALHGSCMGVGTDIGGSIRFPSAFNGVYGLKPSGCRFPGLGVEFTIMGAESITGVCGPMGKSVEDLDLISQVILDTRPWLREPLLALPWNSQIKAMRGQKLRVGIMLWDEVVLPHPYITRVIKDVAAKLEDAGHEIINFSAYDHARACGTISIPLYFTDGAASIMEVLKEANEPMIPAVKRIFDSPSLKELSMRELWELNIARDIYRVEYLQKWASTAEASKSNKPMDVLICPVAPLQSFPHDKETWLAYCSTWNLLDMPAGVIPTGEVLESDKYPDNYEPVSDLDRINMKFYGNSAYVGMPVAIQVVGRRHEDEKVVGAMAIIDEIINPKE